jgi:hypothetical protein
MKKHLTLALALLTVLYTSVHAQLPSYLPADGLVGWWPFNGNANDESGNGNNGTVNGATLAADRFGNAGSAYSFDGMEDFISINSSVAVALERSICFWATVNAGGMNVNPSSNIVSLGNDFNVTFGDWGDFDRGSLSVHGNVWAADSSVVDDGEWHLYSIVADQNGGQNLQFYQDGSLLNGPNIQGFLNYAISSQPILIGNGYAEGNTFSGLLDEFTIYNRALTEQEIQNLFTGTNTTTDSGDGAAPIPQGIPYQAAARDANGQPVVDSPVNARFSLREGAADGATSYIESHNLTTNSIGLFNTVFGNGTPEQSTFDSINWAATTKFLQVEVDLGNGYVDMGTTQLLSVPYAFRSAQAANIKNAALPVYSDNTAALSGGLVAGEMYRTATGDLKIVY